MKTLTDHYIDGTFVESHGKEVMDLVNPTRGKVIGRVTLGDEDDTRRAISAAKRAFGTFGRTTKEERAALLRRLHEAASARLDDLTAVMDRGIWRCRSVREADRAVGRERISGRRKGAS
jgi:aldehyde dehydrogenase (NAD+)